jgi:hypothetical protein
MRLFYELTQYRCIGVSWLRIPKLAPGEWETYSTNAPVSGSFDNSAPRNYNCPRVAVPKTKFGVRA